MDHVEQALTGGTTPGVVRVGNTVRRPLHARWRYVHQVLRHLERSGFDGVPRVLGVEGAGPAGRPGHGSDPSPDTGSGSGPNADPGSDPNPNPGSDPDPDPDPGAEPNPDSDTDTGREILGYVEGEIVGDPAELSDARLRSAAELIRRFHDATAGTPLAEGAEAVLHGDLGPHNTVFDGERAVALIDWDDGVAPGPRVHDLGHAVWCFADIGGGLPLPEQARRAGLLCEAYGWEGDRAQVIDEITARFRRAHADHTAAGRQEAAAFFATGIAWMERHAPALKSGR
ncbi:phosphotransferase [Streptomyces sp. NPDC055078]